MEAEAEEDVEVEAGMGGEVKGFVTLVSAKLVGAVRREAADKEVDATSDRPHLFFLNSVATPRA